MTAFLLFAGLVGLFLGGDLLVRGAVALAARLGISPLVIGLTLVGFGTSLPELVTSVEAARLGSDGIAIGNVIGSNIANLLLILGIAACFAPIAIAPRTFRRDATSLVLATALCVAVALSGTVGRAEGVLLVLALALFLIGTLTLARREHHTDIDEPLLDSARSIGTGRASAMLVSGLVLLLIAAPALVHAAVEIARWLEISETIIGLTIVAVGTSLPELVTSVVAARRGEGAVAYGNVLGSNIFNILGILGITAFITPLSVSPQVIALDLWIMSGATLIVLAMAVTGWRLTRPEGAVLLGLYGGYLAFLVALA